MKIPGFSRNRLLKSQSSERKFKLPIQLPKLRHPRIRLATDFAITFISVLFCCMLLLTRIPGMELLGIGSNWLLIWVVAWSVKRTVFAGALAGIILGLVQDGMTSPDPTHALSLGIVGMLTGLIQKQRFIEEDFISIALIVFGMSLLSETIFALQLTVTSGAFFGWENIRNTASIWTHYQLVALASAILSSLWAPVIYYPLNRWWQYLKVLEQA